MKNTDLNAGIKQIARELENGLPLRTRIAAVGFESPSAYFSDFVLDQLQNCLLRGKKLAVTERSELELDPKGRGLRMSGKISGEGAASLGKFLGAAAVVTGKLTEAGGEYRCCFNAVDVETAAPKTSHAVAIQNGQSIAYMLPAGAAPPPAQIPSAPGLAPAAAYFNAGFARYEAGRYAEAAAGFTRALAVESGDKASLRYRAYSYYNLKDYDGTVADMSRLIQMNPENAPAYTNRGQAYGGKGDYSRAIADHTKAIRLNPNDVRAYTNRGWAYFAKGDHDRAIADYKKALRLNPNYGRACLNLGIAYFYKGDGGSA